MVVARRRDGARLGLGRAAILPDALTNAPAYLARGAAFAAAALVAYGPSALVSGPRAGRRSGSGSSAPALLTLVLGVGIGAQALQVVARRVGGASERPAAGMAGHRGERAGEFRILWIGSPNGDRFPAPGGDPIGLVEAGDDSVRFGLTDRNGLVALDRAGRAPARVRRPASRSSSELLAGDTQHAGALLGPLGVRFVVAAEGDLPRGAEARLDAQVDLDLVPAGGLTIFRNAAALPTAFVVARTRRCPSASDPHGPRGRIRRRRRAARTAPASASRAPRRRRPRGGRRRSSTTGGACGTTTARRPRSRASAGRSPPRWSPERWSSSIHGPGTRTAQLVALALLWLAALWITRKPGSA